MIVRVTRHGRLWKDRVRKVYGSLEELQTYDRAYNIVRRCGFRSATALWKANPILQGSTDPADFGLARQPKKKVTK